MSEKFQLKGCIYEHEFGYTEVICHSPKGGN